MKVSAAICTWNRAKLLDQTLAKMATLRIPQGVEWELLVVNNNSTDDTETVLADHAAKLPLRRLFESKQGHSHARNCAIAAATGDLLIWTDDDVLVDENWLSECVRAAREFPDAVYFGGPIEPWFECDRPDWMCRLWSHIGGIFVLRDYGYDIRPFAENESPAGANMAFRTAFLRECQFDISLGRVGSTLTGADDTQMIAEAIKRGHVGIWVGTARVQHFLPAERLTRKFLVDWFRGAGRTSIRQYGLSSCATVNGMPRWALLRYVRHKLTASILEPWKNELWFEHFRQSAIFEGFLSESRELNGQ